MTVTQQRSRNAMSEHGPNMPGIGLLVVGMHRSGTSALSGILGLLGAETGTNLMQPVDAVNPKGFFEHSGIVEAHDRLLSLLGSSWQDERPLPKNWWRNSATNRVQQEILDIVQAEFQGSPLWLLKDPRIWHSVFAHSNAIPRVVLVLRHPLEVAQSLNQRDGIAPERGLLLWLRYVIEAERHTRDTRRVTIRFDELLADWRSVTGGIVQRLDLPLALGDRAEEAKIDAFVDQRLRHHIAQDGHGLNDLADLADAAFQALSTPRDQADVAAVLRQIEIDLEPLADRVAPWSTEIQQRLLEIRNLSETAARLRQAEYDAKVLQQEVDRVKRTLSWRITKPLRLLSALSRHAKSNAND